MNRIGNSAFPVVVRCFTYNHKPYIEDALKGFCMQETKFPYMCTIVDDASTDGEQEIIKDYLGQHFNLVECEGMEKDTDDYIFYYAQHKQNLNCFFAVFLLIFLCSLPPRLVTRLSFTHPLFVYLYPFSLAY